MFEIAFLCLEIAMDSTFSKNSYEKSKVHLVQLIVNPNTVDQLDLTENSQLKSC